MRTSSKLGFTLIELLVVISIISLLSSVVLASLNTARKKAQVARTVSDLKQIVNALHLYAAQNGDNYPCFDHSWEDGVGGEEGHESEWAAPFLAWPKPIWGPAYHFEHEAVDDFYFSVSFKDVPTDIALMIDRFIDNGDLESGVLKYMTNPDYYEWGEDENRLEYLGMDQSIPEHDTHCWE